MKTLKTIILGLVILMSFGAANAKSINPPKEKISVNYAVTTYLNAIAHGKNSGLSEVMDSNVKFTMVRGKSMLTYNKDQVLEIFKGSENIEQDCETTVSTSESAPDLTVAKVEMKYKEFTRINYLTLANTVDGWKITSIYSVFK
ncbi:nuclear transport factor 2 family protein [Mucilaginibacter paludis]|uniref:Dehydrogenase n=1 Tax=Mucilaginibacter paludis DSM 18603 TaxID=714943 RepID=H1Y2M5_9SPHI|nr:nuclear transport factor 2 family protein [Mucilaginibacter paludis]EHQ28204.1 hypothetical protein Mucpa_4113 [Mucilaginibacter paludis DSM 18603]